MQSKNWIVGENDKTTKKKYIEKNTLYPSLTATSSILFLVMPGKMVPLIAGVDITLP